MRCHFSSRVTELMTKCCYNHLIMTKKKLLPSKKDFPAEWYTTIIKLADLADYGPSKGSIIIKPYGYAIWENVQNAMNPLIKQKGVGNAYFPLLIPMSLLEKEASHIEGFSPELAVVTIAGNEKLEEPLVVRPTSETIMYNAYANWVQSWRDLPIMMNQWNNVVRWEKRTTPFLRTSEFLWQEGHTAHATLDEALETQKWAMDMYKNIYNNYFAIDGCIGYKSKAERFSGADETLTFEALMPSGKALQAATSHNLGQNFSKPFNISFQTKDDTDEFAWQTSWGLSTRSIGGLILTHGDDDGLVLPPKLAPIQVIIVTVNMTEPEMKLASELANTLTAGGIRAEIDSRDEERFGFKLNKWEVKGVPIIFKIGAREVENQKVTAKARFNKEEREISVETSLNETTKWLGDIQTAMLANSTQNLTENTRTATNYDEFKSIITTHKGFVKVFWNDNSEIEATIKKETTASSRCMIIDHQETIGKDFITSEPSSTEWIFAQSY